MSIPHQTLDPHRTTWHITFGTYGTRLHGGFRATVDKQHNQRGTEFLGQDAKREQFEKKRMNFPPRYFDREQQEFVEQAIPAICERGGWGYRICAAGEDHVHTLCDVVRAVHGEKVRRLLKRWLGQDLSKRWPLEQGASWWAEEGSNKAIHDGSYLNNAFAYVLRQRATPFTLSR